VRPRSRSILSRKLASLILSFVTSLSSSALVIGLFGSYSLICGCPVCVCGCEGGGRNTLSHFPPPSCFLALPHPSHLLRAKARGGELRFSVWLSVVRSLTGYCSTGGWECQASVSGMHSTGERGGQSGRQRTYRSHVGRMCVGIQRLRCGSVSWG
jgi:hypothetical protein